ncbi:MAG: hypothetical protein ABSB35_30000 [Bryobacteraceae bacterium]
MFQILTRAEESKYVKAILGILLSAAFIAQGTAAPVPLQISNATAPAGGWAQIAIYAATPTAITSGHLVLNLDSTAFGNHATVGLFGANGDAAGLATVTWPLIDIQFSSPTGGIGELAGLPVIVVSLPVLASAAGRKVVVTATSPDSSVTVASGSVIVQGTVSVQNIPAGMGVVPAGTRVPVYGSGFTSSTTVTIDGAEISSTEFVSPAEIDVAIGGATELVGKQARITESGVEFDYFCFEPNAPLNFPENTTFGSAVANVQPLFPLLATSGLYAPGDNGGVLEVQNPNATAASVTVALTSNFSELISQETLTIPPGSWAIFDGAYEGNFQMNSNVPVRSVAMQFCGNGPGAVLPVCLSTPLVEDFSTSTAPMLSPSSLAFTWQAGSSASTVTREIWFTGATRALTASVTSGSAWLSVDQPQVVMPPFDVHVNASQLEPGTYQGTIQVSEIFGPPLILPVSLTVSSAPGPMISATPSTFNFSVPSYSSAPYTQAIQITSSGGQVPFSVGVPQNSWVQVSPTSGTTPATLNVTWNPASAFGPNFELSYPGSLVINGPANTITMQPSLNITGLQAFPIFAGETGLGLNGLVFSAQMGSASQMQTISVLPAGPVTATSDQPWLSVAVPALPANQNPAVVATANPAGLSPGVYNGNVTISEPGIASINVPVTLGVWSTPPALSIMPTSMTFVQTLGETGPGAQFAEVTSGGVPVPLTIQLGASWLGVTDANQAPTPAALSVYVIGHGATALGQYLGSFTVESNGSSVYVTVTYLIEPGPAVQPVISQVVNAASELPGAVSPGEIVSVLGYAVGSSATGSLRLTSSGTVATMLNGLQVTFDGQPAPLIYTSGIQTNLIVPYEIAGKTSTVMQVTYTTATGSFPAAAWVLPVVASAPGVFTVSMTGIGQGAIVNDDGSINSAANPAVRGSLVSIYATGEGQTGPPGVTGSVTQSDSTTPSLPVTVMIGGVQAPVQYAGEAPGEVAGLLQVNAMVPTAVVPGSGVPIMVSVGGVSSQKNVTIAVK